MTLTLNIQDAKAQLSRLVSAAENGGDVVIARHGKPVVKLVPIPDKAPRPLGIMPWSGPSHREALLGPIYTEAELVDMGLA
ncbi:MAG: type II toxin-antitoxin system prevent-host-death family antitoxin [Propionibacteriaceae bacterium]|jgi:prevent-host-death family protein|nr:type II toxin-antitoxin system prevent-host-death family antitoxin [Propionibacteriaceae bacterium]